MASYGAVPTSGSAPQDDSLDSGSASSVPPAAHGNAEDGQGQSRSWRGSLKSFYERNFGLFLVFVAQSFGSVMSTAAKLLTSAGAENQLSALQIIFVRMLVTAVLGSAYMWYKQVPDFPLGPRGCRRLLVLRGLAGFTGLFGLYYSLSILEISDAVVITFLVPTMTALVCFVWLKEPYTPKEAAAGFIALAGVLLVARPPFLFGKKVTEPILGAQSAAFDAASLTWYYTMPSALQTAGITVPSHYPQQQQKLPSPAERSAAVLVAILGTFAAAVAYSTIRIIGRCTHSLISVNYFAVIATLGSTVLILVHPDLHFVLPRGVVQWTLLTIIGVAGFLLQFLLTEGLQREKGGRATNLTYLQLVFTLVVERVIWGTTPPPISLAGSALIIGAAIWISLQKNSAVSAPVQPAGPKTSAGRTAEDQQQQQDNEPIVRVVADEETALLGPGTGAVRR
ncbi:U3 small nucleolar RNA-associated protein 25 [Microdochium nivale]|nr:U3 small nucleolar RNA-associated protein 25 [Microdochium nivale]